jgi:MtN3 and saliva related transmembrane protein
LDYITVIGLVAASLTTFALMPQSIKAIRTRHTKDISYAMVIMLDCGLICWLTYGLLTNSLPIIAANTVSIVFATIILFMKIKYH